jgi:Permuted papain-like amidase enzyme, YaeF/YiiX, C92 family
MIRVLPSNRSEGLRLSAMLLVFTILAFFFWAQFTFLITRIPVLYYYCRYSPQEGDVIFQSLPHGDLVDAIEGITHSPFSHCGVVLRNEKNQWVVFESIYNVHETPLFLWELRGRGGNFAAYRLDSKYSSLVPIFKKDLLSYAGRPYDFDYDMTKDQVVYCSDLVYLAFDKATGEKMGTLEKLRDLDWKPFQNFIETEQEGKLPLDRVMITPASLAQAPQLHEVYRSGFY